MLRRPLRSTRTETLFPDTTLFRSDAAGSKIIIEGGVGTAFGCTLQDRVEPAEVLRLAQALLDAGADRISLADTVGYADPAAVDSLFTQDRKSTRLNSSH